MRSRIKKDIPVTVFIPLQSRMLSTISQYAIIWRRLFLVHIKRIHRRISTGQIAPRIPASWPVYGATIQLSQNSSVLYILNSGSQGSTSLTHCPQVKIPQRYPPLLNQASSYSWGSSMSSFPNINIPNILGSSFWTSVWSVTIFPDC